MIVDSSAILAILFAENDADLYAEAIARESANKQDFRREAPNVAGSVLACNQDGRAA